MKLTLFLLYISGLISRICFASLHQRHETPVLNLVGRGDSRGED
jgi:hypothetical protein